MRIREKSKRRLPMRDMKSDWKRWGRTERISAVTFVVVAFAVSSASIFGELEVESASKAVLLQGNTAVEKSPIHGADSR
jgi:hypothetical protein